jgi:uncharacterized protein (TIGR00730 family)
MKRICVFCGSSPGAKPEYMLAAEQLGHTLVNNNLGLIYGGARVGIMGKIAQTVLDDGGEIIGVIPRDLFDREVAFKGLSDLRVVDSMHERKALMADLSDGFIALPGGLGTLEEFLEVITWAQLGIHKKPCGFLNIENYYDGLINFLNYTVSEKFVEPEFSSMILIDTNPESLLSKFYSYQPPIKDKAEWALKHSKIKR